MCKIRQSNLIEFEFQHPIRPQIRIRLYLSNSKLFLFEFEIRPSLVYTGFLFSKPVVPNRGARDTHGTCLGCHQLLHFFGH
jgi:hypothetical protein